MIYLLSKRVYWYLVDGSPQLEEVIGWYSMKIAQLEIEMMVIFALFSWSNQKQYVIR